MTDVNAPTRSNASKLKDWKFWYCSNTLEKTKSFPTKPAVGGRPTKAIKTIEKEVNNKGNCFPKPR